MTDEEYFPEVSRRRGWARVKFMAKNRPLDLTETVAAPFLLTFFLWVLFEPLLRQLPI